MKKLFLSLALISVAVLSYSQSKSYDALRDHFGGKRNVRSFSMGGFLCRTVVRLATPNERILVSMLRDVNHIRFMTIPNEEFGKQGLSVNGFKKYLSGDSFESMVTIKEHGDVITVFHRSEGNRKDCYFVLVEEQSELVAIELKGYIDPGLFNRAHQSL